ncbi:hypothetical protein MMC31_002076 [Peltigera leucophlebia]|nr:hypothetical protein [Peltigera leucophlebia]
MSLPLVIWDTSYVLLRPHSMIGGDLHSPIFVPYALYSTVDYVYGFPAYNGRDGFTGAQSSLNIVETLGYLIYLAIVWKVGTSQGPNGLERQIEGRWGAFAALLGFAISVMTLSKTTLYLMNEFCSGFKHIGHNTAFDILLMWILPNCFWIALPAYMILAFSREILQGLAIASEDPINQSGSPLASFKKE